ncbi:hypothetical protein Q31b_28770 [Novipirellula aureliae]|uniref:Uncharacterized protein n=1 Tax=Novipirellula aureliae TaxID=2527966 RepID=A0A5C6DXL8_9BACT|nr:hypothetical protein [Novipirellula aureliae]TWU41430.1 hypothetical protein Q31b_28770 [Novipirellula aureliae]
MSAKEQHRQKKLAKKRSKEIANRKRQAREKNAMQSLAGQMQAAGRGAIDRCFISEDALGNTGIGSVLISRFLPDGRVGCVRFLIDSFCLGVKDVHGFSVYPGNFSEILERFGENESLTPCAPEKAKKFVESAIEYAAKFDLHPVPDYKKVEAIWTGIDSSKCLDTFEFGGENGKPCYTVGPADSQRFQQKVLDKLWATAGEGNFDFVMNIGGRQIPMPDAVSVDELNGEDGGWMDDPELDVDIDDDVEFDPNTVEGRVVAQDQ